MLYKQILLFHIFLLFIRITLAFKNRRQGLVDKSLLMADMALCPQAQSSYSLLSINWSDIRYKYPTSSKLPAEVKPK